jgi:hypothetical protein
VWKKCNINIHLGTEEFTIRRLMGVVLVAVFAQGAGTITHLAIIASHETYDKKQSARVRARPQEAICIPSVRFEDRWAFAPAAEPWWHVHETFHGTMTLSGKP